MQKDSPKKNFLRSFGSEFWNQVRGFKKVLQEGNSL